MNGNGYKILYQEEGKVRYKRYYIIQSCMPVNNMLDWYMRHPPPNLKSPKCKIIRITNKEVEAGIWNNCPF